MTNDQWTVTLIGQARKAYKELPDGVKESLFALIFELEIKGPLRHNWPNYGKIKGKENISHCHIEKGRPTYVVCWKVEKNKKYIEVYYAGTHEKAPY